MPNMGAIKPNMGNALFTKTQQRVLGLLFGSPDRSFYSNEIVRISGVGNGTVQRELGRLVECGLVSAGTIGNQKHYQANRAAPIFEELRGIALKTFALADVLRARLAPLAKQIRLAFVYGSVAKGSDRATSDIDVMILSDDLSFADVIEALDASDNSLGRRVNPTMYRVVEFQRKASEEGGFLSRVMEGQKIFLIGAENDIPEPRRARAPR
jgi:predicted nucleotidyltransferase